LKVRGLPKYQEAIESTLGSHRYPDNEIGELPLSEGHSKATAKFQPFNDFLFVIKGCRRIGSPAAPPKKRTVFDD
jgi:hypothetical protein